MKLRLLDTRDTDPYFNLALEEHLLSLAQGEIVLYLWQNDHTVVIGHNQNALRDVNLTRLKEDGGRLARRLSGGGAVYHDLGNLNFTFIVPKTAYDPARQTRVVLEAARALGIPAEASGRNDLLAQGRKFSGNAYYCRGDVWYHHGTLLVSSDLDALQRYLNVSPEKLKARGVASVRSRVCNLCELAPGVDVQAARKAMAAAFGAAYGGKVELFDENRIHMDAVGEIKRRIVEEKYLLGEHMPFDVALARRFAWGEMQLSLCVRGGRITACQAHSDAMDEQAVDCLPRRLTGCTVDAAAFARALEGWADAQLRSDVLALLRTL